MQPMPPLVISLLTLPIAVCRLEPDAEVPVWAMEGAFYSITRTMEELSIVCEERLVPADTRMEGGWRALKVEGPLDFSLTGILAVLSGTLARAGISLFAVSTFDTDYILIKAKDQQAALAALRQAGITVPLI
jgi:uncharacterized protein